MPKLSASLWRFQPLQPFTRCYTNQITVKKKYCFDNMDLERERWPTRVTRSVMEYTIVIVKMSEFDYIDDR
jgi:hypothetical protein